MAAEAIGALRAMLETNAQQFVSDMGKARRSLNDFRRSGSSDMEAFGRSSRSSAMMVEKSFVSLKSAVGAVAVALTGLVSARTISSFISVGREIENLKVRMEFLTGSTEKATASTQALIKYAGQVPFQLQEIQRGATNLLVVSKNTDELNKVLRITGDIAAATGLSFDKTAEQVQRAFSAGIASADLFREKGVNAMLGFQAGVSYSAQETRDKIIRMWDDSLTNLKGGAAKAAGTWDGILSMLSDKWFQFRDLVVNTGLFEKLKEGLKAFNDALTKNWDDIAEAARKFGMALRDILPDLVKLAGILVKGLPTLIDWARYLVTGADALARWFGILKSAEIEKVQDRMNKVNQELKSARAILEQLEKTGRASQRELEARRNKIKELEDELRELGALHGKLTDQLRHTITITPKVTQEVDKLTKQIGEYRNQLKNLTDEQKETMLFDPAFLSNDEYERVIENAGKATEKARKKEEAAREKAIEKWNERVRKEAEKSSGEMERAFSHAAEGVQDAWTSAFESIFSGGVRTWEDFADTVKRIMIRLAAEVATLMIFNPQIGSAGAYGAGGLIGGGGGGILNASYGAGGLGGSGIGFSDISGAVSLGKLGYSLAGGTGLSVSGLATSAMNYGESAALALGANPGTAFSVGMTAGNAVQNLANPWTGVAGFAGGLVGNLAFSGGRTGSQNTNANVGATVGGIAGGAFFGPVGAAVGAFAGNYIGGLFGSSKTNVGPKASKETQASFYNAAQSIFQASGVPLEYANNIRNMARSFGEPGVPGGSFEETFNIGIRQFIRAFSADFGKLGDVLERIDFTKPTQAIQDMQFATALLADDFGDLNEETTQADQILNAISESYTQMRYKAEELGLSIDKLKAAAERAVKEVKDNFAEGIEQGILQLTDPIQYQLDQLAKGQEQRVKEAKALGADLVQVERLNALERENILKQSGSNVKEYLQNLFMNPNIVAPATALKNARSAFGEAVASRNTSALPGLADTFINLLRKVYASGPGFAQGLQYVTSSLQGFQAGGSFTVPGFGGPDSKMVSMMLTPGEEVSVSPHLTAELSSDSQTGLLTQLLGTMRMIHEELMSQKRERRLSLSRSVA